MTPSDPFSATCEPWPVGQNSTGNEYPENVCQSCGYSVLRQSVNWYVVPAPSEWMTGMIGIEGRAWPLLSAVISEIIPVRDLVGENLGESQARKA